MTCQGIDQHRLVLVVDTGPAGPGEDPAEAAARVLGPDGPAILEAWWVQPARNEPPRVGVAEGELRATP